MPSKLLSDRFRDLSEDLEYEIEERIEKSGNRQDIWYKTERGEKFFAETDAMQEFSVQLSAAMEALGIKQRKRR